MPDTSLRVAVLLLVGHEGVVSGLAVPFPIPLTKQKNPHQATLGQGVGGGGGGDTPRAKVNAKR